MANLEKHGFDFAEVIFFDWATALITQAKPDRNGGIRMKAIGYFEDGVAVVIYATLGTEALSVISFRRASKVERMALHGQAKTSDPI